MNGWTGTPRGLFADRSTLGRLGIALAVAVATVVVIDFGGTPFSLRVGQVVQRDIRGKKSFTVPNPTQTAKRRDQAADAVPPIYRNDSRPIEELQLAVDQLVAAIAEKESIDQLPAAIVSEWSLMPEQFAALRSSLDSPEKHAEVGKAIAAAFLSLRMHGILDVDAGSQRNEFRPGAKVQIELPDGEREVLDTNDVIRLSLLDVNGPLAALFAKIFPTKEFAEQFFHVVRPRLEGLPATLLPDQTATNAARQEARDAVPDEFDTFNPGDLLVEQDRAITDEQHALLKKEHEAWVAARSTADRARRTASLSALVIGLCALAGYYIGRFERPVARSLPRLALLAVLVVCTLAIAKRLHGDLEHGEVIAIALAAMTLAITYSQQFALLITFGLGLLCAWMFGTGVNDFVVLTGGSAAAVLALNRVRSRTKLIAVGAIAGATFFVLSWATGLLAMQPPEMLLWDGIKRAFWGVVAGVFMGGILPFLEKGLGIVTDINLLELSDVSHPLLLELMRKAPGTYNHSVAVATLAEGAAEQIGANALLCRVGSFFHDVGKMLKPHYFVENQGESGNRHESLNPAMSTLIIIGHVKDGADLAHEHHLPQPIVDLIEQHHGTTLVEYFFQEAAREVREDNDVEEHVEESAFRYPGPKPQSKEACVLMIADAVESASRTLSEPTPGRIEGLVHELTLKRLLDGQFDECGITLQEIALIKESLVKSLNAIYHGRVKYPEQRLA